MITAAIRRTKKDGVANNKDFYQTHPSMVSALREWMDERWLYARMSILDPCCGKGVIYKGLIDHYYNMNYFDRYQKRYYGNYLLHKKNYDVTIMNPPYSLKYKFLDKAMIQSKVVICLLPINISNYNMFFEKYENIPGFVGKIQMSPKLFLSENQIFKPGGTSQYAWYIWDKDNKTDCSKVWYKDLRKINALHNLKLDE